MNLYELTLGRGNISCYVVATDPTAAYELVKRFMDKKDLCFHSDRKFYSIKQLAKEKGTFDTVLGEPYLFLGEG
jgi:hypothetical protein